MEVCDMIKSPDQELLLAKLLKGKAKFHGYQPVLRYLMENKHSLSKRDMTLVSKKDLDCAVQEGYGKESLVWAVLHP